jgi:hypothetical protein
MFEPAAKISVERLIGNGSFHVHKDDTALFTFTRVQGDDKNVEHYFEPLMLRCTSFAALGKSR